MAKVKLLFLILFFLNLCSCETAPSNSSEVSLRRNWVRRIAPKTSLTKNSSSQRFSPIITGNTLIQGTTFGGIKALSKKSGQVKWKLEDQNGVSSHGVVSLGKLFFGSYSGKASSYNIKSKSFDWSVSLDSSPISFSVPSNGVIFSLTDLGTLYALALDTGAVLWSVKKPAQKTLQIFGGPSPKIYKDQVIAAFPDGSVASFNQSSGKQKWANKFDSYQKFEDADFLELEGSYLFAGSFDEALFSLDPNTGDIRWRVMQGPVSTVSIDGSRLYYSTNNGEIVSLEKASGNIVFKKDVLKGVGNKPTVLDSFLIVSDSKGPVFVLNKNSGSVVSKYNSGSPVSSDFSIDKDNKKVYYLSNKGNLFKYGLERTF